MQIYFYCIAGILIIYNSEDNTINDSLWNVLEKQCFLRAFFSGNKMICAQSTDALSFECVALKTSSAFIHCSRYVRDMLNKHST